MTGKNHQGTDGNAVNYFKWYLSLVYHQEKPWLEENIFSWTQMKINVFQYPTLLLIKKYQLITPD